ncbi:hypothetical protein A2U01_0104709, partial [Trifolium medium]|nr:hypothetical protein [Trifolium medium]
MRITIQLHLRTPDLRNTLRSPLTVHLKMKYHDERGGVVSIKADMAGAKKCHQSLHKTAKKT